MIRAQQNIELVNLNRKLARIQYQINNIDPTDNDLNESLEDQRSEIENKVLRINYDLQSNIELPLTEEEKGEWRQNQKACGERATKHLLNQQKAFAIIIGQCTQRLQDKLHDDAQWDTINKTQRPLELYSLIERVVMQQTGDEYPPNNLVDNILAVLTLKQQNNQTNTQWYEKLNTRVDVAESVGVEFGNFTSLWSYCCEARQWGEYQNLSATDQATIRNDSKERLLGYLIITNSSSTSIHESVKNNLLEAYIAKRDEYPATRSDAIALLNKYDEKKPPPTSASEGTAFVQKGKKKETTKKGDAKTTGDKKQEKSDKKFFEDKECFICGKKGHGAKKCPNKTKPKGDDTDDSSISSKSSKIDELEKKLKSANKQFTQLKAQWEESDESDSDDEQSHFQFAHLSLANYHQSPEKAYHDLSMKQTNGKFADLNLRQVILLDNQSTMSLFCNKAMVTDIRRSDRPLTLRSNGGSMEVTQLASIGKDKPQVWFSTKAITNILSLKEVIKSYRVTYDSYEQAFIVWREEQQLPNMLFKMHRSGLHFYDPKQKEFAFVVTVSDNMKMFSNRQIAGAEKARSLQAALGYPSDHDMKWILKSNQVNECPVTHDDARNATKIWGIDIASLKGKTTRKTPESVLTDMVEIPTEIRELHRIVTLTIDVFFVNKVPFFLTLSRNICFSTVTHLEN